jgi:hypothetical protein
VNAPFAAAGLKRVRSEPVDRREQLGLAGCRDAEHGDHRGDPDRDADRRQRRAQTPRAQADAADREDGALTSVLRFALVTRGSIARRGVI